MNDMNVALRLSLINQMRSGADAAKRDLQGLRAEAEKLGGVRVGASPAEMRRHRSELLATTLANQRAARAAEVRAVRAAQIDRGAFGGSAAAATTTGLVASGRAAGRGYARAFVGGIGMGIGVGVVGKLVKDSIVGAASDEFERDQLRVIGNLSEAQMAAYRKALDKTARLRGIGAQGSLGIFGGLLEQGLSPRDAAALTDGVAVFSKATGSSDEDAVAATAALRTDMGLSAAKDIMAAYDAIAVGGKQSALQAREMAKHLPKMLADARKLGETGQGGVKNIVALMAALREGVGSDSEAISGVDRILGALEDPKVADNARKFGVNIKETMRDAEQKGLSPVYAALHKIHEKTKGDPASLRKMFPDRQTARAFEIALGNINAALSRIDAAGKAAGSTMKDYETATDNASEAWARFSSSVTEASKSIAEGALPEITRALDGMTAGLNNVEGRAGGLVGRLGEVWSALEELRKKSKGSIVDFGVDINLDKVVTDMLFGEPERDRWDRYMMGRGKGPSATPPKRLGAGAPPAREAEDASMKAFQRLRDSGDMEDILYDAREWRKAARSAMEGFNEALGTGLDDARSKISAAVAEFKAMLNFAARPTISPTIVPATAMAAAPSGGGVTSSASVTQNISTSNPQRAARLAQREQDRAVRMALANALHDTGTA